MVLIQKLGNVGDLPRLVFIDNECGNLKVINDSGKLIRNINQKKKSDVLQSYICRLRDKCCGREYFFSRILSIS